MCGVVYMQANVHVQARRECQESYPTSLHISSWTGSSTECVWHFSSDNFSDQQTSEVCLSLLLSGVMVTNIGSHVHILCGCWELKRRFDCIHSKLVHPQIYFPSSQVLFISEA